MIFRYFIFCINLSFNKIVRLFHYVGLLFRGLLSAGGFCPGEFVLVS
jgi:hypothetical protein